MTDSENNRVQVFGLDGTFRRKWGSKGRGDGYFHFPVGIAVSSGEVFVCDFYNNRVQVFGLDGTYRRPWRWGEEEFQRDITVMGEEVFVCDFYKQKVNVFGLDGTYRRQFDERIVPTGIDVIGEEVFVVDDVTRIKVFR